MRERTERRERRERRERTERKMMWTGSRPGAQGEAIGVEVRVFMSPHRGPERDGRT